MKPMGEAAVEEAGGEAAQCSQRSQQYISDSPTKSSFRFTQVYISTTSSSTKLTLTLTVFFRSRAHFGLGIPELHVELKKQRLIRRHQLRNSQDPRVRRIHQDFSDAQHRQHSLLTLKAWKRPSLREEWKECVHEQSLLTEVKTNKIKGNCQIGTAGVGFGPRKLQSRSLSGPKRERERRCSVCSLRWRRRSGW